MHNIPDFLRITPEMQQHFKKGGMIKRADGSYSRRGLWDNIRANRGSGKKPTKEMLEQEAKIRAEEQYGGTVDEFGKGGYTVKRSSARKGKTHVVIGPDGTKKYFGDSKLGQHPKDPERKKAFYARHKHNLANNPYFRAFARATWEDGGEVPHFDDGGYYGSFVGEKDARRMQGMFTPTANSMTPSFFAMGGLNKYQDGDTVIIDPYRTPTRTFTPPASNYPMYERDMRGAENRWADRQPLEGMQTPPVIPANPTAPTTVAEDRANLSQEVKQNAAAFNRPDVERMEEVPTEKSNDKIPTSLIKSVPITKSYLENTYESTEGIPKTVLQFFDTQGVNPLNSTDTGAVRGKVIFDQATEKAYTRVYDPKTKKFRIITAPISNDKYTKEALLRDVSAYSDTYAHSFAKFVAGKILDEGISTGQCTTDNCGKLRFYKSGAPKDNYNREYTFANVDENADFASPDNETYDSVRGINDFMTINSDKSFDENIDLMKQTNKNVYDYQKVGSKVNVQDLAAAQSKLINRLKRNLTEEEQNQLEAELLEKQKNTPYDENAVKMPVHYWTQYYLPEFQDETDPRFQQRNEKERRHYMYQDLYNDNTEEQRKLGGKTYRRGGSIRRFDVGGDNPLENLMNSNNQFNSTYSPYTVNPWATGQPQQPVAGNPFNNQLNTQNQAVVTGSPYGTTIPQTANSGQGINTTTPQQSPAVTTAGTGSANNGQYSMIATNTNQPINVGGQRPTATNMITGQSANQTMMNQGQDNLANDDFQLPTIMGNEGFGQNIKLNSPQQPVATNTTTPATTTTPAITATTPTTTGTTAVETPEQKAAREKAERAKRGSQIARGTGLAGLGAIGLAKELTSVGPKSQETAILDFTTQSLGNSVNRLAVREQNKGIAYGKHGGKIIDKYGSYSEGDIIEDITPTERYALEKLGYKFQIL